MLYARPCRQLAIAYGLLAALGAAAAPALFFILLFIWDLRLVEGARWLALESVPLFPWVFVRAMLAGILAILWCRFRSTFRKPYNPRFRLNRLYMRPVARPEAELAVGERDVWGRILPPYRVYLGTSLLTAVLLSTGTQLVDGLKPVGGHLVTYLYWSAPTQLTFDFDVTLGFLCAAFPGTAIAIWRMTSWRSLEPDDPRRHRIAFRRLAIAYGLLSALGVIILGLMPVIAWPTILGDSSLSRSGFLGLVMTWARMAPAAFLLTVLWVLLWSIAHPVLSAALLFKWRGVRKGTREHCRQGRFRAAAAAGLKGAASEVTDDIWARVLPPYRAYLAMCAVTAVLLPAVSAITQGYIASAAFYYSMWARLSFQTAAATNYPVDVIAAFLAAAFPGTTIALWRVATRPQLAQERA